MRSGNVRVNIVDPGSLVPEAVYSSVRNAFAARLLALLFAASLVGCDLVQGNQAEPIRATGIVETTEVIVASDLGGRVTEVMVAEGERVEQGDPLFRLENEVLAGQETEARASLIAAEAARENAQAALALAETNVEAAQIAIQLAQVQLDLQRAFERRAAITAGANAFNKPLPAEFALPDWYFLTEEVLQASEAALREAKQELEDAQADYANLVAEIGADELNEAEARLGEARIAYIVALDLARRDVGPNRQIYMDDAVRDLLDEAETELEEAQDAHDDLLTAGETRDLLEARARLTVAQERWETTRDQWLKAMVGDQALSVQAAELALNQAEIALTQAEAARVQAQTGLQQAETLVSLAQAALELVQRQVGQLSVSAAVDGVLFVRGIEPGEVLLPGVPAMTLGEMDPLKITVFIPEDQYGKIGLNERAVVEVDSFPGERFEARVTRISDQAEFTPRNVQTEEERRTTVFAIELFVTNPDGKLKPGMPVSVSFE